MSTINKNTLKYSFNDMLQIKKKNTKISKLKHSDLDGFFICDDYVMNNIFYFFI